LKIVTYNDFAFEMRCCSAPPQNDPKSPGLHIAQRIVCARASVPASEKPNTSPENKVSKTAKFPSLEKRRFANHLCHAIYHHLSTN
jgi:hypothetical protein